MGNVLLVDSNYVLKVAMYARENDRKRTPEGEYVGGVLGFLESVHSMLEKLTAMHCILLWDGGVSKRRLKRFPDYKSTRWKTRAESPDALAFSDVFFDQKRILFDVSKGMRMTFLELRDREADDLIIHLITLLSNYMDPTRIYVASGDKDLLQACRLGARVYRMHRRDIITEGNFQRKIGVPVDKYILWRAIIGERQRNDVDGVPNVGEKTATALLMQEGINDFTDMMHYCGRKEASSREKAIVAFFELICRNIEILDLEREIFSKEEDEAIMRKVCQPLTPLNKADLIQKFDQHKIKTSDIYGFSSFISQFSNLQQMTI